MRGTPHVIVQSSLHLDLEMLSRFPLLECRLLIEMH